MDTDEPVDTRFVPDDFDKGEHETLDKPIILNCSFITQEKIDFFVPFILANVAAESGGRIVSKYSNITECETLLTKKPEVKDIILKCLEEKSFRKLRLLKLLRPAPVSEVGKLVPGEMYSFEKGWKAQYVGDATKALWDHIQNWFAAENVTHYAKYTAIVQSSGMGKSRVVDEMSKSHFVIPVNLREPESNGYPPCDVPAYEYLIGSNSQRDALFRSCAFMHALFIHTAEIVDKLGTNASEFWKFMSTGMQASEHGDNRTEFFKVVVNRAKEEHFAEYEQYFPSTSSPSDDSFDDLLLQPEFPLNKGIKALVNALTGDQADDVRKPPKRPRLETETAKPEPFPVVVAFDEVHTMTKREGEGTWSRFGEIRRVIRGLKKEPIFALFLSTSGTLFSIAPTPGRDISTVVPPMKDVVLPFYELGFDQLAKYVALSKSESKSEFESESRSTSKTAVRLSEVASEKHFVSYGRPLRVLNSPCLGSAHFLSRWQHYYEPHGTVIDFAAKKLLGGISFTKGMAFTNEQKFACLAQRIPIEFLSAKYSSQISTMETDQVNSHMRVVLKAEVNLETMVTTSPSEPILSEASSDIMRTSDNFNAPQALQTILGFAVDTDEPGELLVALLFTLARDAAIKSDPNKEKWCSVTALLQSLFYTPESPSSDHVDVINSYGWSITSDAPQVLGSTLSDEFKDSKVYFSHFIKVDQQSLVDVEFVMGLMVRGAAILCAKGQPGMNVIIPFLFEGDEIKRRKIGIIMIQVKNGGPYKDKPDAAEVCKMDPSFSRIVPEVPVIRMFFALASPTPALKTVEHVSSKHSKGYRTYDFWVAGLSAKMLAPVKESEKASWESILQASHHWENIYAGGSNDDIRKSMNPGSADEAQFWRKWIDYPCSDV